MKNSLLSALVSPNAFFENAQKEKENLRIPALIVLAAAVLAGVHGYIVSGPVARLMAGAMPSLGTIVLLAAIIVPLIVTFVIWAFWTGIIYAISLAFKGTGSFKKMLECTGYGYIPQIAGSLITLIAALEYIPKVVVPQITSATLQNPEAITAATKALMQDPAMTEFTQIATIVSIVFLLWSANIWIFAVKHARNLSMRDAAICVFIPVLAYILYTIYSLSVL